MDTKTDGEDAAPEFLTAAEVAAWFRVGLSTIYYWRASGRIPSVKFNGVVRFQRQSAHAGGCSSTRGAQASRQTMYLNESAGLVLAH